MYSEELLQQTREFFNKYPMASMKHFGDDNFGFCTLEHGKYIIEVSKSGKVWEYDSVNDMIEDGWAID